MQDDGFVDIVGMLTPAVYALFSRGKVVYIGQSVMPLIRIMQHKLRNGERLGQRKVGRGVERFPFDHIMIRECTLNEINKFEREMIVKHQPKYNINHKYEKLDIKALLKDMVPVITIVNKPHPYVVGKLERRI